MRMLLVLYIRSIYCIKGFILSNTDHLTVLYPQTDFEKDVDIACRSGKEQMVSY